MNRSEDKKENKTPSNNHSTRSSRKETPSASVSDEKTILAIKEKGKKLKKGDLIYTTFEPP
jgi:hypothetical protein